MTLELEDLHRALTLVLDDGRKAVGVERCHGGTISDVYRVTCAPGPDVIVKLYPAEHQWMLEKEVHVYGLLRQVTGVPFPAVLHAETAGPRVRRGCLVLQHLPGIALSTIVHQLASDEVQRIYRTIGTILRAIHQVKLDAFGYITTRVIEPRATNAAYMRDQFKRHLAGFRKRGGSPAIASAVEALVEVSGEALAACTEPVLCHDDLHDGNVLVERVGDELAVTGVLDVENAVAGDPLLDLARTLYFSVRDDGVKRAALLDGYGDLGSAAEQRLRLYAAHQAIELWCWFASEGRRASTLDGIANDLAGFATREA